MGEVLRRFHRFGYLNKGETVLYEPTSDRFVWLLMHIPVAARGQNIPNRVFSTIIAKLVGEHNIHCSVQVPAFKALSQQFKWRYIGQSSLVTGCSYFVHKSGKVRKQNVCKIPMTHRVFKQLPYLRTFHNSSHVRSVISQIDEEFVGSQ